MPKINKEEYEVLKALDSRAKSIVRQARGWLWVAEQPIMKDDRSWFVADGFDEKLKDDNLFQFIQWEDEEPYNIAELIKEYKSSLIKSTPWTHNPLDFGSEDIGMKRDKEWLKDRLESLRETDMRMRKLYEPNSVEHRHFNGRLAAIDEVLDFIDELDEPEVLSSNWIDEHRRFAGEIKDEEAIVKARDLIKLLVPKQELPVIPKFVADWIEVMKQDERPLYSVMSSLMNKTNHEWGIWKSANKNFSEIVAQAWLYGYKVEEKPKYYIIDKNDEVLWYRDNKGIPKLSGSTLRSVLKSNSKDRYQFTEQEIKDYDERFWPFAVKVEESEE